MSKYTAEQVEETRRISPGIRGEMLGEFATLLRERESAKAVVTDIEPVAWRCRERNGMGHWRYIEYDTRRPDSYELRECEIENVYDQAALEAVAPMLASAALPIPMILHCPSCGTQHIDAPDDTVSVHMDGRETVWDNPPHRSHLCHNCGIIWRPADVPTTGVEKIQTKGKNDADMPVPMLASARVPDELSLGQRAVAAELLRCCESWEPGVRVMGNVKAGDAADLLRNVLAAAPKPETIWPKNAREKAFSLAREMLKKGSAKPEKE